MNRAGCAVGIGLLAIAPLAVLNGWVITVMWGWFITPQFGLVAPSLVNAIGLALFVGLFRGSQPTDDDDDMALAVGKAIGRSVVSPLFTLAIGFVVQAAR